MAWRVGVARGDVTAALESSARPQSENFRRLRARPLTVLRLLGLRAGPLAIGAITVWIVRRPSRRAHKRSRLERLGAPSVRLLAILGSWVRL